MSERPSLLIISFSPIVSDARLLKQIDCFRDEYDITTLGHGPTPAGVLEHLRVPDEHAIWRYPRIDVILRRYRRAYARNGAIASATALLAGRTYDVVFANDVDAVGVALWVDSRHGVHADLHEYSPRQHDELLRFRLFVKPFIEWMCRQHVAKASSWSTVSNGLAREYERQFGFLPELVTNAAPFIEASPTPPHDPIRLVHSGAAFRDRAMEIMMEAVQATPPLTLDLYLTPNDPIYLAELHALAEKSQGRVRVNDPVPYSELAQTLRGFDLGLIVVPPSNFSYRWGLPNKLFDFVQARLGMVVGPSPEMVHYVDTYGLGRVADDFTPSALAAVLRALTPDDVARFKASAHENAHELSSESQVEVWKRAIDRLLAR